MKSYIDLLMESADNPTAVVHALRDKWVAEQHKTPMQINSGQCFDFADELERERRDLFEAEGFGNFCNHDYAAGQDFADATGFLTDLMESRGWHPPKGLTWDDMFHLFCFDGVHGWAYCEKNGLCYDIEAADGVRNVFDLPFLKRIIDRYRIRSS